MDNPKLVHGNVIPMEIPWDRHKLLWDGTDKCPMDNPKLVHENVIPMEIPWDRHKLLWDGTDKCPMDNPGHFFPMKQCLSNTLQKAMKFCFKAIFR